MEENIGTVISSLDGPSPVSLDFVVNKGSIHRGQFIELDYSEGTMIALILDVMKTNRYFERAESVKEFEAGGKSLFQQFPVNEWEYLLARTKPMGVFKDGMIKRPSYPPSPGVRVRLAGKETLKKFLGFDDKTGLNLGELEYHDLPVNLNLTKLFQKHLAVLAMSGSGKSYSTSVLLEELLERNKDKGRIATILFDPHGEYKSFAEPLTDSSSGASDYSSKTKVVKARDIKIGVPKLSVGIFSSIIPGMSSPQRRDLARILLKLKQEMKDGLGPFDLTAIKNEIIKDADIKAATSQALIGWMDYLEELHLFSKVDSPSISDLVKPGVLTVIDLGDIIDLKKKQIIVSYFASRLFNDRRGKQIPPFLLIVEESHQFVPERASEEYAVSRGIMRTIAREGRKFGASLCLISQRPIQLDTTTLSQCNTKIILRITNPYDLDHIGKSAEGLDKRSLDMITSLRVGEALVVGEAVNYPTFFKVRKRKSLPSKHEKSLEDSAREFEEKKEEMQEEYNSFI